MTVLTTKVKKFPVAKAKKKALPERDHRDLGKSPDVKQDKGWMVVGFDTSLSSLAGAAIAYDAVLGKLKGPVFSTLRWSTSDEYFNRIRDASKSHELVLDLMGQMKLTLENDEVWIAQEEPWPMGMALGKTSGFMKQQAEISGAFLAGLVRWGYPNIAQMNNVRWRQMVAKDLGITIHHTKWQSPDLALKYNCTPKNSGKFRAKEWALSSPGPGYAWMHAFDREIPDFPDIIETRAGKVPRPEGSKAKAVQAADEYDALAIAWTFYEELSENGILKRA